MKINEILAKIDDAVDRSNIYSYREIIKTEIEKARKEIDQDMSLLYGDGLKDLSAGDSWFLWIIIAAGFVVGLAIGLPLGGMFL